MKPIFNKKASYDYFLKEKFEAGIILTGGETKAVRSGSVSLSESFVKIFNGQAILHNAYISPYKYAYDPSYDPKRERQLLLKKKEIDYFLGKLASTNLTIVPTKMYTSHNLVKVEVALAQAKKKFDKRDSLKTKALDREAQGFLRADKLSANKDSKG